MTHNYDYEDSMQMLIDAVEYWRISGSAPRYGMPHPISPTDTHDHDEAENFRYQAQAIGWASR